MARLALIAGAAISLLRLGVAQTTTTLPAISTPASTETQAAPSTTLPAFEVDVVFPRPNVTYNFTEYIPIVFAFQNLSAAALLGPFTIIWAIMPYGSFDGPRPSGTYVDEWSIRLSAENVSMFENPDGSPFIFVNSTNTTALPFGEGSKWELRPHFEDVSVYALQWYIQWDAIWDDDTCYGDNLVENVFFHVQQEGRSRDYVGPNPGDLGNVTNTCAQFGSFTEINTEEENVCIAHKELPGSSPNANPCAVKIDEAMASSISSKAAFLAKPTETSSTITTSSSTNSGATPTIHIPVLAAMGLLVVL